jgi:hypothetical protein
LTLDHQQRPTRPKERASSFHSYDLEKFKRIFPRKLQQQDQRYKNKRAKSDKKSQLLCKNLPPETLNPNETSDYNTLLHKCTFRSRNIPRQKEEKILTSGKNREELG